MSLDLMINFDGDCRQAIEFYAKVFETEPQGTMTYGQAPHTAGYTVPEAAKERIMYSAMQIHGVTVMLMDYPPGMPLVKGDNISPTITSKDMEEIRRLFAALKTGGEVDMELQETFYSALTGAVTDQFGVGWQLVHDSGRF